MKSKRLLLRKRQYLANAPQIIAVLTRGSGTRYLRGHSSPVECLRLPGLKNYQRFLHSWFGELIEKKYNDYISKTGKEWLIVGDRRQQIAEGIQQTFLETPASLTLCGLNDADSAEVIESGGN